jgi:HSP20 family molecular chaperone IbpA
MTVFELSLQLNVEGFRPEEIHVEVNDSERVVTVTAESRRAAGDNQRALKRTFQLPQGCLTEKMKSVFTRDGLLKITMPKETIKEPPPPPAAVMTPAQRATQIHNNYSSGTDRMAQTAEGLRIDVDADGYSPDELSVSVDANARKLTVSAEHVGDGVCRKFSRQYQVFSYCFYISW